MIDKTEYERFREYLAKRGLSRNSCNHYVAYVSSIERHSTNFLNGAPSKAWLNLWKERNLLSKDNGILIERLAARRATNVQKPSPTKG